MTKEELVRIAENLAKAREACIEIDRKYQKYRDRATHERDRNKELERQLGLRAKTSKPKQQTDAEIKRDRSISDAEIDPDQSVILPGNAKNSAKSAATRDSKETCSECDNSDGPFIKRLSQDHHWHANVRHKCGMFH